MDALQTAKTWGLKRSYPETKHRRKQQEKPGSSNLSSRIRRIYNLTYKNPKQSLCVII